MKFNTTVRGKLRIDDKTMELVEKKLSRLDKYFAGDTSAFIVCSDARDGVRLEVTIKYGGMYFRGQRENKDLPSAADTIVDLIERQIEKNKTKLEKRLRSGSIKEMPVEQEERYEVLKTKKFELKPMSSDEAILQMNMLGHNFFLYIDSATETPSVIYKRENGGYGLIETK